MRTLHGEYSKGYSVSPGAHATVSIFANHVHASLYRQVARACKCLASIQQFVEAFTRITTGRAELDVTGLFTAFRSESSHAHRERIENTARLGQYDIAGALRKHGADLAG